MFADQLCKIEVRVYNLQFLSNEKIRFLAGFLIISDSVLNFTNIVRFSGFPAVTADPKIFYLRVHFFSSSLVKLAVHNTVLQCFLKLRTVAY